MIRTIVSLTEQEKTWLDAEARRRKVPMTQIIREAVVSYRKASRAARKAEISLQESLRGTWKHGDGLAYQRKIRAQWT